MKRKIIKHGNHSIMNENDGYIYSLNESMGYDFNSHLHKCYEIIRIIDGELLYTVEGREYTLSGGDLIFTAPDELHSFSFPTQCTYRREFIHIYPGFIKDYPEICDMLKMRRMGECNAIPAETVKKYGIAEIFNGIYEYCEKPVPETDFMVLTYALQLLVKINQIVKTGSLIYGSSISGKKSGLICDYIDRHYMEKTDLDTISAELFLSPSYVSRVFKKETGMTVKAYINLRRITQAKNLIIEGEKATCVFRECGFSDYSTFYRAFVKYAGMTPDKFKNIR